jgi:heterodisulfide reductase subunit B2
MKYYSYFPGCSSEATAAALGLSAKAIGKPLDMQLKELEDWNCCGSTPYGSLASAESIVVAARNLALAEKTGLDLVTPCSSCYVTLNKANEHLKADKHLAEQVNQALGAAKLEYDGTVRVRLLMEVIANEFDSAAIQAKVKHPLNGLKVASYYGCQMVRPDLGFDNPEFPKTLDNLAATLGAEAVPFPMKAKCCGGSITISDEGMALGLMHKLLASAKENGAQVIVTPCPLCQTNLDAYQGRVNSKFKTDFKIPILFVTQLMGVAFGIDGNELGLKNNIVPGKALAKYL